MRSRAKQGPSVPCPTCGGTGKVKLTPRLLRVLTLVEEGHDTAAKVYAALDGEDDVQKTAINYRLEELWQYGLLGRTMRSHRWIYHRIEPKPPDQGTAGTS
jgi:hypothetical protein